GVLVLHEGGGQDDNARARTNRLAELGYVAFALDYLGGGTQHSSDVVQAKLGALWNDHDSVGELAKAGYDVLVSDNDVDPDRITAAGRCWGGLVALQLARTGVPLRAVIGFHPGFASARPESARIRASVLMVCGSEDPVTSSDARAGFVSEMQEASVADWRL